MKAARAIIIRNNKILVMRRLKEGSEYYTLVGGRAKDNEDLGETVRREVKEETGLDLSSTSLVFIELHPEPYNEQYIYLCEAVNAQEVAIQSYSEEALLNKLEFNIHEPYWVAIDAFGHLPFRTPQLQKNIVSALKNGFPKEPIKI